MFYNKNKESNEEINKIMEKYDKEGFKQKKDAIESEIGKIKSDLDKKEKILKIYQDLNNIDDDGLGLKEIKSFLEFKKKEETAAERTEEYQIDDGEGRAPTPTEQEDDEDNVNKADGAAVDEEVVAPEDDDEDNVNEADEAPTPPATTTTTKPAEQEDGDNENAEAQDDDDVDEDEAQPPPPALKDVESDKQENPGAEKKYRKQPSILNLGLKNFI